MEKEESKVSRSEDWRAREEKVVRARWVPRMSARGTAGWEGGLLASEECGMMGRWWPSWCCGTRSWEVDRAGRVVRIRLMGFMLIELRRGRDVGSLVVQQPQRLIENDIIPQVRSGAHHVGKPESRDVRLRKVGT